MLKAANEDQYNFLDEVKVYGERARRLKEIFLRHGFHLVYDNDLGDPVVIRGFKAVNKSAPQFFNDFQALGGTVVEYVR